MSAVTQVPLPSDLVEQLTQAAKAMGLDVPAYLTLLLRERAGRVDPKAKDAIKFMFTNHGESLKKLAQ